jgi:hypothetical protein
MVRGYLLRALRYHGVDVERLPAEASEEIRDQVFRDGSLRVNAASIVSVSVPNSFNHAAAEVIRNGIVQAVEKVWGVRIPRDHVRIIREGAAAAQVAFTEVTGGLHPSFPPDAVPKWRAVLPTGATGATDLDPLALGSGERKLVAVLDVGAGTTDLTIIEATTAGTAVLMNAGVPLGGDDVDRVIIGAVAADPARTERAGVTAKCLAMGRARDHKEQARDPESRLNFSSDQAQQIVADLRVDVDLDPASIAGKCARRLAAVAALSVRGLFGLLPENFALSAVVLSGRGALLPEIGRTVVEVATERGCTDVRTLANAVQLKLAVAYGCGILNDQSSTVFDRLVPTRTLGRVVEVRLNKTPIANIGAFTPVPLRLPLCLRTPVTAPGSLPILDFRVRLDTTARTVLREAEIDPQSQLGAIGLYGHVAHFRVGQHDVRGANPGLLLVFDVEEGGYVTLFAKSVTTCAPDPDPTPIDPISRLPLPFPERVTES